MYRLRVHSEENMEGKMFIAFVALAIKTEMNRVVYSTKNLENRTVQEIIDEMKLLRCTFIESRRKPLITEQTGLQKFIMKTFGVRGEFDLDAPESADDSKTWWYFSGRLDFICPCANPCAMSASGSETGLFENVLDFTERSEFREWLREHHSSERGCWIALKRGRGPAEGRMRYLDAVEEALCFGWIDTTVKTLGGAAMQKFMPRSRRSSWSELNKERCRRLEMLGLMTDAGRAVLPDMSPEGFVIDAEIGEAFRRDPVA